MKKIIVMTTIILFSTALYGCSKDKNKQEATPIRSQDKTVEINNKKIKVQKKTGGKSSIKEEIPQSNLALTSPNFANGEKIPVIYTCDGENKIPELEISGTPDGTKSLFIIMSEIKENSPKVVHWTLWGIPRNFTKITSDSVNKFSQGSNDFGKNGYQGPCPEKGETGKYVFELWALDKQITHSQPEWTAGHLMVNSLGHILGKSFLKFNYSR